MFGRLTVLTVAALYLSFTEAVSICNADNCLRQIKGTAPAWPYCSRYLTTTRPVITPVPATITVTATRTVFAVFSPSGKPVEYITRKGAPYIAPNKKKREVPEIEARVPSPMTGVPIAPRQALPTWASSCTGDPGRLSSACTCLLGYTAERSVCYFIDMYIYLSYTNLTHLLIITNLEIDQHPNCNSENRNGNRQCLSGD
ncbi:hypothetical protein TWF788_000051 [Orbilia oligospora]|uniref:Uncharacterized protein n=1 Tax=Orbilia oligospora TaxID=2813651 RepID=A0A7C8UBC7_ORBOL|nr:hypothetical protein TWF788_000051 [Orbilia oligospora]